MFNEIFTNTKINTDKLQKYNFVKSSNKYSYTTDIVDGQFALIVTITLDGVVSTKVIDKASQEEYVLHLIKDSVGEFVGRVRLDIENVLTDIKNKCFDTQIFKSIQAQQIIQYVNGKYGDQLEFLWQKFTNNAVLRRHDNDKWYALLIGLPKNKLGIKGDEMVEIIDVRIQPEVITQLIDNKQFFAGYHMNKKHWMTICLDSGVPTQNIINYIDNSYNLAQK